MRLNSTRVTGLGENFDKLIIGEEVEPWERNPFRFQIVLELPGNLIQISIILPELLQRVVQMALLDNNGLLLRLHHDLPPELINVIELRCEDRELFLDVICTEDILEVDPLALACAPFIENLIAQL